MGFSMSLPNYVVIETFAKRSSAEAFCERFNVPYLDVIFNHGGLGLEARAYDDFALQGISQEQRDALISHLTRNIK
jgi:hypothetical protein